MGEGDARIRFTNGNTSYYVGILPITKRPSTSRRFTMKIFSHILGLVILTIVSLIVSLLLDEKSDSHLTTVVSSFTYFLGLFFGSVFFPYKPN